MNQLTASRSAFLYGAKAVMVSSTARVKGMLADAGGSIKVEGSLSFVALATVNAQTTNICCVREVRLG